MEKDLDGFDTQLQAYLAGIPRRWYDTIEEAHFEAYYAGMLYPEFRASQKQQDPCLTLFVVEVSPCSSLDTQTENPAQRI